MTHPDFEAWYVQTHRSLVAALTLYAGGIDEAAEAVDEALVRAFERWEHVGALSSPTAWACRVAVNVVKRRARRRKLEQALLRRHTHVAALPSPEIEVWNLVRHLSERQRLAIVLRYVADLPEAEIASVMGVTRSTVSSTLADGIRRLRAMLGTGDREGVRDG